MGLIRRKQGLSLTILPAFGPLPPNWATLSILNRRSLILLQVDMPRLMIFMGGGLPFSEENGKRDEWGKGGERED